MTTIYNSFKLGLFDGNFNLGSDTIKILLLSDSQAYTPDIDGETYVGDVIGVSATELNATNYARKTLSVTTSQDNTDDEGVADASDLTYTSLGGSTNDTIDGAIIYKEVTNDADSPLIGHFTSADFPMPTNGGDVDITIDTEGVLNIN
jgi:hypothetical protein